MKKLPIEEIVKLRNIKVRFNSPKQSEEFQLAAFKAGCVWLNHDNIPRFTDAIGLTLEPDGELLFIDSLHFFKEINMEEVEIDECVQVDYLPIGTRIKTTTDIFSIPKESMGTIVQNARDYQPYYVEFDYGWSCWFYTNLSTECGGEPVAVVYKEVITEYTLCWVRDYPDNMYDIDSVKREGDGFINERGIYWHYAEPMTKEDIESRFFG